LKTNGAAQESQPVKRRLGGECEMTASLGVSGEGLCTEVVKKRLCVIVVPVLKFVARKRLVETNRLRILACDV
jgi:hypothetical protein